MLSPSSKSGPSKKGSPVKALNLNDWTKSPIQHLLQIQSQLNHPERDDLNAHAQLTRWGMQYTRNRWSAEPKKGQITVGRPTDALIIGYHQVNQKGTVVERVYGAVVGARIGTPVSGAVGNKYIYLRINPLIVQDSTDKYRIVTAGQYPYTGSNIPFYYAFLTFEIELSNLLAGATDSVKNKIKAASIPGGWRSADLIWWTRYGRQGSKILSLNGKADGLIKKLTFHKITLRVFKTQKPSTGSAADRSTLLLAGLRYNTVDTKGNNTERKKILRATSPASIALWNADKIEIVYQMVALSKKKNVHYRMLLGVVSGVKAISLTAGGYGFKTFEGLQSDSGEHHIERILKKLNDDIQKGTNKVEFEEALAAIWPVSAKSTRWLFDVIFEPTYVLPDDNESGVHRTRNSIYYNVLAKPDPKQPKQVMSNKLQNNAVERALKGIIDRVRTMAFSIEKKNPVIRLGNAIQYNWGSLEQPNPLTMDEIEAIVRQAVYPKTKAWKQMLHFGQQTGLGYLFRGDAPRKVMGKGKNKIFDLFSEMHNKTIDSLPYRDLVDGIIVRVVTGTTTTTGPPIMSSPPSTPPKTPPKTTVFSSTGKPKKRSPSKTPVLDRTKFPWLDAVIDPLEWMMLSGKTRSGYRKEAHIAGNNSTKQAVLVKKVKEEVQGKNTRKYGEADRRVFVLRRIKGYEVTTGGKTRHVKGYLERIQDEVAKADKVLIVIVEHKTAVMEFNRTVEFYVEEANKIKPTKPQSGGFMKIIANEETEFKKDLKNIKKRETVGNKLYGLILKEITKIQAKQAKIVSADSKRATNIFIAVRSSYAEVLQLVDKIREEAKQAAKERKNAEKERETISRNYDDLALAEGILIKLPPVYHPSTPTTTTTTPTTGGPTPSPVPPLGGIAPLPLVLPLVLPPLSDPAPLSLEFWNTLDPTEQEQLESSDDEQIQNFITTTMQKRRQLTGPLVPTHFDINVVPSSPPSSPTSSSTTTSPTSSSTTTSPIAPVGYVVSIEADFKEIIEKDGKFSALLNKMRVTKPHARLLGFDYGSFVAERQRQHDADPSKTAMDLLVNRGIAFKKLTDQLNVYTLRKTAVEKLKNKTSWFRINTALVIIHEAQKKAIRIAEARGKMAEEIKIETLASQKLLVTDLDSLETTMDPSDVDTADRATEVSFDKLDKHSKDLTLINNEVQNDNLAVEDSLKKIEAGKAEVEKYFNSTRTNTGKRTATIGSTSITVSTFVVAESDKIGVIQKKIVAEVQKARRLKIDLDNEEMIFQTALSLAKKIPSSPPPKPTPPPKFKPTLPPKPTTTTTTTTITIPPPTTTTTTITTPPPSLPPSTTPPPPPVTTPTPSTTVAVVAAFTHPPPSDYPHDHALWLRVPQDERDSIMTDINASPATTTVIENKKRVDEAIDMVNYLMNARKEFSKIDGLTGIIKIIKETADKTEADILQEKTEKEAMVKEMSLAIIRFNKIKVGKKKKKRLASQKKAKDAKPIFEAAMRSMDQSLTEINAKKMEIDTLTQIVIQNISEAMAASLLISSLTFLDIQRMTTAEAQFVIIQDNIGLVQKNTTTLQGFEKDIKEEKAKLKGFVVTMKTQLGVFKTALTELIPQTALQQQQKTAVVQLNLMKKNLAQVTTIRINAQKELKAKRAAHLRLVSDVTSDKGDVDAAADEERIASGVVLQAKRNETQVINLFNQEFNTVEALKKRIQGIAYVAPVPDKKEIDKITEAVFEADFGMMAKNVFDQVSLKHPDVFTDKLAAEVIIKEKLEAMMPAWGKRMTRDMNLPETNPVLLLNTLNQNSIAPYVDKQLGKPAGLDDDEKMDVHNAVYTEFYSMQREVRSVQMASMIEGRINSINVPLEGPLERSLVITFDDADPSAMFSRLAKITIRKPVEMDFKSFTITDPLGLPRRRDGSTTVLVTGFANATRKRRMLGGLSYEWITGAGGPGDISSREMSIPYEDEIDVVVKIRQGSTTIRRYDIQMKTSEIPTKGTLVSTLYRTDNAGLETAVGSAMGRISHRGPDRYYDVIYFFFVRWH